MVAKRAARRINLSHEDVVDACVKRCFGHLVGNLLEYLRYIEIFWEPVFVLLPPGIWSAFRILLLTRRTAVFPKFCAPELGLIALNLSTPLIDSFWVTCSFPAFMQLIEETLSGFQMNELFYIRLYFVSNNFWYGSAKLNCAQTPALMHYVLCRRYS